VGGGAGSAAAAVVASMSHPAVMPPLAKLNANNLIATSPALDMLLTQSLSDCADPASLLGFLTCTLNSTNQILHPCILVALFGGDRRDGPNEHNILESKEGAHASPPVLRGRRGKARRQGAHRGHRRRQDVLRHQRRQAPPVAAGVRPHHGAPRGRSLGGR
jgi:hypothetical protein